MDSIVKICEVRAKSILNKSKIPGVEYAINPYIGCAHGCAYCYARFMRRYTGHLNDEWGTFVDVKINTVEVLRKQLQRMRKKERAPVLLSSVTDPYQPVENEYRLTRGCIELLHDFGFPISILTKSDLVLQDVDILNKNNQNEVGMTIITLDEKIRGAFEPGTHSIKRRIKALRKLIEQDIDTYAFIGPIIPELTTDNIDELFFRLSDAGIKRALVDKLNIKAGNKTRILHVLENNFPEIQKSVEKKLNDSTYYDDLREKIRFLSNETGINSDIIF